MVVGAKVEGVLVEDFPELPYGRGVVFRLNERKPLEQVQVALNVWANADLEFEPAAEARALRARLGG